MTFSMTAQTN